MDAAKQIFQTKTKLRWRTAQGSVIVLLLAMLVMVPVVIFTLKKGIQPPLPPLNKQASTSRPVLKPVSPLSLNKAEAKRYTGFADFLRKRQKLYQLTKGTQAQPSQRIRAAFYVDWDPQAFYSLQKNIGQLNTVVPEWFFIDPTADTLKPRIDKDALAVMKSSGVKVLPLINNINEAKGVGEFDGEMIHRIFHDATKRKRLITDIVKYLHQYGLQGINIDFEEFSEKSDEPITAFQKELYETLHRQGLLVTQDIMPSDSDFDVKALAQYNDYLFLMAYDEHYGASTPGAVSSQRWMEKVLDETAAKVPSEKIILCLAGYGYDWAEGQEAETITYQQALANAKQYGATIEFDNNTYNNHYRYTDGDSTRHEVHFTDAATAFNTLRFADEYGTAGTAVWRLGSEDERIWSFYKRDLSNAAMQKDPFDFVHLETVETPLEKPDYVGDGEVLNVVTKPTEGKLSLEINKPEGTIAEETYEQLPTRYVIQKFGKVHNQVVLTFDDGPDPDYTPKVLDILKKEKVPAAFFVVGVEAENNLPLLQRIYREGHEIGNHTFTHPNIAAVSEDRASAEMESTRLLIEAVTGRSTVLFRAPYNADAEPTTEVELRPIALSRVKNYYTVGESIDPADWEPGITADSIYARTIKEYEANPEKGIILLHDAGGNRQATVDALTRIIHYFKSKGVQFTTVANLLHVPKEAVMPVVHNNLLQFDSDVAYFGYWAQRVLGALFWTAIVLGLLRSLVLGTMAFLQHRKAKKEKALMLPVAHVQPPVSIIVPAYNEEVNAVRTVANLLQQDYPSFDIVFVDDGSKDSTYQKTKAAFSNNPRVKILTKPNGGKASALNFGIAQTNNDFVVCIDADTQLHKDAITQMMKRFTADPSLSEPETKVAAVAGNVKVGNERTLLTKWQSLEYITAQNFDRRAFDLVNGITVVPGAIGAFRKSAVLEAGGFTNDTLAEDCDLTIRLLRLGYRVVNCTEAIAVTEAPETLRQFMKQRFRWSYGVMQAFWKNRDALLRPKYKGLGLVALPNVLLFQIVLPLLAPLADLMFLLGIWWNWDSPQSLEKTGGFYLMFLLLDVLVSIMAFGFEKEKLSRLVWILPQRFAYRQLMYVVLFRAVKKAIKGESQGWGVLKRTGNVTLADGSKPFASTMNQ